MQLLAFFSPWTMAFHGQARETGRLCERKKLFEKAAYPAQQEAFLGSLLRKRKGL